MKELLAYLNRLQMDTRQAFAVRCHTTEGYLRRATSANVLLGPIICVAIERETNGEVTRQMLRPNDFWLIWPDLAKA